MMLAVILWALAGLLLMACIVILGALFTPVRVSVEFNTSARPTLRFKIALFGGILPVATSGKRSGDVAKETKRRDKTKSRISARQNVPADARRMLRDGPTLVSRIAARVKFEAVDADISFGLPDPADTGMIYGALTPVARLAETGEHSHISLTPDFNEVVFKGRGCIAARVTPATLIPPLLSFAWTVFVFPPFSEAIR